MKPGGSAALAVGAGYILGRQHKLRTALMLGAAAASGRLIKAPGGGGDQGDSGSQSGLLGKLSGAGKTAAISTFSRSADKIGERLSQTATSMRGGGSSGEEDK